MRCIGAFERWGIGHHLHDLRQHGRCTDFSRAHHQSTAGVERGADQLSPKRLVTGTGSPVSMDSSTALRPSVTTPSTGTFLARAHAQQIADMHLVQLHIFLTSIRVDAPRSLGRQPE